MNLLLQMCAWDYSGIVMQDVKVSNMEIPHSVRVMKFSEVMALGKERPTDMLKIRYIALCLKKKRRQGWSQDFEREGAEMSHRRQLYVYCADVT